MRGARAVRDLLKAQPERQLDVFVVWAPVLRTDTEAAAKKLAAEFGADVRVRQYWDPDKDVGLEMADWVDVGKSPFAWDAYFYFVAGTKWAKQRPAIWAHQLAGADPTHAAYGRIATVLRWMALLAHARKEQPEEPAKAAEAKKKKASPAPAQPPEPQLVLDSVLAEMARTRGPEFKEVAAQIRAKFRARWAVQRKRRAPKAANVAKSAEPPTPKDQSAGSG